MLHECCQFGTLLTLLLLGVHQSLADRGKPIEISRKLTKDGFHRDIETTVVFDESNDTNCQYVLVESLPAGCFVDVYQISQIGTPKIWTDGAINLESPEYLSSAHDVYVYLERSEDAVTEVTLPVHMRYHRPTCEEESDSAHVHIPHPKLFTSCTDRSIGVPLKIPCNNTPDFSTWAEIPFSIASGALTASIPVGQIFHKSLVVVVTMAVTWTGCVWLLYYISSKPLYHDHSD